MSRRPVSAPVNDVLNAIPFEVGLWNSIWSILCGQQQWTDCWYLFDWIRSQIHYIIFACLFSSQFSSCIFLTPVFGVSFDDAVRWQQHRWARFFFCRLVFLFTAFTHTGKLRSFHPPPPHPTSGRWGKWEKGSTTGGDSAFNICPLQQHFSQVLFRGYVRDLFKKNSPCVMIKLYPNAILNNIVL